MTGVKDEASNESIPAQSKSVKCYISKQQVASNETVEIEHNGKRVRVHKRFGADVSS